MDPRLQIYILHPKYTEASATQHLQEFSRHKQAGPGAETAGCEKILLLLEGEEELEAWRIPTNPNPTQNISTSYELSNVLRAGAEPRVTTAHCAWTRQTTADTCKAPQSRGTKRDTK